MQFIAKVLSSFVILEVKMEMIVLCRMDDQISAEYFPASPTSRLEYLERSIGGVAVIVTLQPQGNLKV